MLQMINILSVPYHEHAYNFFHDYKPNVVYKMHEFNDGSRIVQGSVEQVKCLVFTVAIFLIDLI